MSLGLIATVCNALRNVYIPALTAKDLTCKSLIAGSANSVENPTNNITSLLTVETLEFNFGVIAACMPTFVPLFTHPYVRQYLGELTGRSTWTTAASDKSGGTVGQRNFTPENCANSGNAYTISNARYEHRRSSQSDMPLRQMDKKRYIGYEQSYSAEHAV